MQPNWFIALPVEAGAWFAPLRASAPPILRAFHPEDLHLTLAFLEDCGEEAARTAWQQSLALPLPAFEVTLAGLACMGNPKRPSAFAVALDQGHPEVGRYLGEHRDALLQTAGARPDTRPPLPHITVGRPPRSCTSEERAALVAWTRTVPPIGAQMRLGSLALYTWAEDRNERQFVKVARRS